MTDVKLVRFAAVLVVLSGYVFVFRAGEARVGARVAGNAAIAEQLRDGDRILRSRGALEQERARLRDRLRSAGPTSDRSVLVARFLRDAASTASVHRTAITAVAASGPQTSAAPATDGATHSGGAEPFDVIPLDMTVEGRYADVLATVRALSAGGVLASVDIASLARKDAGAPNGELTASLHVGLERSVPMVHTELTDANARPR